MTDTPKPEELKALAAVIDSIISHRGPLSQMDDMMLQQAAHHLRAYAEQIEKLERLEAENKSTTTFIRRLKDRQD